MKDINSVLKQIPKIDRILSDEAFIDLNPELLKISVRKILEDIRQSVIEKGKTVPSRSEISRQVEDIYYDLYRGTLYKVVNATGVPIHTNLGRSPISEGDLEEAFDIAKGYSNLEYDVDRGKRGDRYHHAAQYLKILTGAEDALIVNNNASAVFLILNTLARSREVIVSRGELVEIGGSFRVPDVMRGSGAKLVEVGTTNKTRVSDYKNAVTGKTAMLMKVHKSNYEIVGFSEETSLSEIAHTARESGVISYYDAGSGLFEKILPESICEDITIPEIARKGFDLISFSGDKMLGGCQAGVIVGRAELIKKIKKNQLMRMLRVDKITLALLQSVFRRYITGDISKIPVNRMLSTDEKDLKERAEKLSEILPCKTKIVKIKSTIGGGSCPLSEIDSWGVAIITNRRPQTAEKILRKASTPVIARVSDDRVTIDVRTVSPDEFELIKTAAEGLL